MTVKDMKFIDLFAGIGGFRQALESYGAKCIFSSEKDKYAIETYEANYGEKPSGDITKIKSEDIPKHDILCAGFPCQPFSISGKQKGFDDERGIHFFEIHRIVKYHKPSILFLENVANLKKHNDSQTIEQMRLMLEELGYIVNMKVLNASDYNVPQSRKRIYFVCFNKDKLPIYNFEYPKPMECTTFLKDILEDDNKTESYRIIRDDIVFKDMEITECEPKPIRIGTINKGGQGDRIYSPLGHAITLSAEGGGSGAKTGAYLINGHVRKLSPRECARVQGFPETFIIAEKNNQAYKQFGNSVALPVLKNIVGCINNAIQQDVYKECATDKESD
ncbi:DNA cytosine methyltransferase [Sarcina sp. JB2]|uniref:DNA cytosine methyltransferase n=1 Tax=Candidatus Sarcina troglodytae TaxID=2726954 RepID=A0ACD1BGA8_9CLOT|nr:DNA cytosine methyltransferase [Sarcina sp. JB2]QPJ86419.1 DNA cytosine methyltransferase [Sarcina sp. JB2]